MMLVAVKEYRRQRMGGIEEGVVMLNMEKVGHILPTSLTDEDGKPFECFLVVMEYGTEFVVGGKELSEYFDSLSQRE